MSYGMGKKDNQYARRVHHIDASKTVWMAVAFSFAMQLTEDDFDKAAELCEEEWRTLHENGIVPQKPRGRPIPTPPQEPRGKGAPACDMTEDCTGIVTMVDSRGFLYCDHHGRQRAQSEPCRQLRTHELNRLKRGEMLGKY